MNIPSNEELAAMANVFDEFVIEFCDEYKLSPLATTGLMMARLSKLSKELEYQNEFQKLLGEILSLNEKPPTFVTNNSTSLH